jgi:uncharacterized phage protein (TIGR01671 family)
MREIKFRGQHAVTRNWVYGDLVQWHDGDKEIISHDETTEAIKFSVISGTVGQFTGLKDKNGKEIYEGDVILIRKPYRSTQTHYGDNIPLGSYTEPLEPSISECNETVQFADGCFVIGETDEEGGLSPLNWELIRYDLETMKEGFSGGWVQYRENSRWSWGGEDGDLQYLLETYKLKTETDLLNYIGVEVIGNIHVNPELVNPAAKEQRINTMQDPNTPKAAEQQAENAQESASQDSAMEVNAEEGGTEG